MKVTENNLIDTDRTKKIAFYSYLIFLGSSIKLIPPMMILTLRGGCSFELNYF